MQFVKAEKIEGMITAIARDADKLQDKIHRLACSILKVWHDASGDVSAANLAVDQLTRLQGASPYHRNAFSKWVSQMLPMLEWAEETKVWFIHVDNAKLMGKVFIAARDLPFWKVAPAPAPEAKPFDMAAELFKLIKRVENHTKKPVEGDVIDLGAMEYLREAAKAFDLAV